MFKNLKWLWTTSAGFLNFIVLIRNKHATYCNVVELNILYTTVLMVLRRAFAPLFRVTINFIDRDGDKMTVNAKVGDSLLDVAKDNDVDLEGQCRALNL